MPVPIVSLLSTMHTGDVSNRGGSKTEHTGRATLYKGTRLASLDLWRGVWEISFCVLTYDDYSGQNKGTEKTPGYELRQLIRIQ